MSPGPACQAVWSTDAVFVGHVERVSTTDASGFASRTVRIQVLEVFRGEVPARVEVRTGAGGSDCGYSFAEGSTYLVYASRATDGRLSHGHLPADPQSRRGRCAGGSVPPARDGDLAREFVVHSRRSAAGHPEAYGVGDTYAMASPQGTVYLHAGMALIA